MYHARHPPVVVDGVGGAEMEDYGAGGVSRQCARQVLELEHALLTVDHKLK